MKWNQVKTPELVERARLLVESGVPRIDVAKEIGVSRNTIGVWLNPEWNEKAKAAHRKWKRLNKSDLTKRRLVENHKPSGWAGTALCRFRRRAKELNLPFAITKHDILRAMPVDGKCPVFGVPFQFAGQSPYNPSIDRIVPEKGYVPGNISVISFRANTIKSDSTAGDLRAVLDYIEQRTFKFKLLVG